MRSRRVPTTAFRRLALSFFDRKSFHVRHFWDCEVWWTIGYCRFRERIASTARFLFVSLDFSKSSKLWKLTFRYSESGLTLLLIDVFWVITCQIDQIWAILTQSLSISPKSSILSIYLVSGKKSKESVSKWARFDRFDVEWLKRHSSNSKFNLILNITDLDVAKSRLMSRFRIVIFRLSRKLNWKKCLKSLLNHQFNWISLFESIWVVSSIDLQIRR